MQQPLSNPKKRVIYLGLMLNFHVRKTRTSALNRHCNANKSSVDDVSMLCKQGRLKDALHILHVVDLHADSSTYVSLLRACIKESALSQGKLVHAHMNETGFTPDVFLHNTIVNMYAKCGSLVDARRAFDQMPKINLSSWNAMIAAYARQNLAEEAFTLFHQMRRTGIQPDQFTFASIIPACTDLTALIDVHEEIIKSGFHFDVVVGSALVDMYAKCGCIEKARDLFDKMPERNVVSWTTMIAGYAQNGHVNEAHKLFQKMPERNVVSWNAMIAGYAQNGRHEEALKLFRQMRLAGVKPNSKTFASVLPACANLAALEKGIDIHEEIVNSGFQSDVYVANTLVDMYAKCGSMDKARDIFDKMSERNIVSWTAMIAGYAQSGCVDEALKLFRKMPNKDVVSWTTMVSGYAQNGYVVEALNLFQKMPERNVVSWNAMIAGYEQNGHGDEALNLFRQMQLAGVKPNPITFVSVLPACANLAAFEEGRKIHEEIIKSGLQSDVFVTNALIDMYAKCGNIEEARNLFEKIPEHDVVSWTAMIAGYMQNGRVDEALKLFQKMPERNVVSWTAIIAGYVHNGYVDKAQKLFQTMPERNVVSWNTMIAGYAQNGHSEEALKLFQQMQLAGVKPNSKTFASVLPACANLAALEQGMEIHEDIIRNGLQFDAFVGSALIDMYAKCGSIEKACNLFDKMHQRNVVSWTAMIAGYAMHGHGKEAIKLFEEMQQIGMKPNHVTLVCVLSACCHAGLVDKGRQYFESMSCFHIMPGMEHYVCMVDLLGRAGHLDEAEDFINKMPVEPDATVWRCLLGACRVHNNLEIAEHAAEHLFQLDPENAANYVLLSNIYAAVGRWDGIQKMRKMMKDRRVKRTPGCSWIEVNKQVHTFLVGDRSHQESKKNYIKLEESF